ncbi:hypothetical protein QQP08_018234 [Theobroma cacao]|nr:hypothetical protein QQP08_018234 [Theobroma cacao]
METLLNLSITMKSRMRGLIILKMI